MNIMKHVYQKGCVGIAALVVLAAARGANLHYEVQPGSTITPWFLGQPTGPTESLRGRFAWHQYEKAPGYAAFDATSLVLQSISFRLTLNETPANDLGTSLFESTHTSYFGEVVDWAGVAGVPLEISGVMVGVFAGPLTSPERLEYPELFLTPHAGGFHLARIALVAVQVPEPRAQLWVLIALGLMAGWRWILNARRTLRLRRAR